MTKSIVDMSRPNTLYGCGVAFIVVVSLIISNVPMLALSKYIDFAHRREICAGLFLLGSLFGAVAAHRHMQRVKTPWRVPQSQVSITFLVFFLMTLAAVLLTH